MRHSDIRTKGRRIDEWIGRSMKISRKMGREGREDINHDYGIKQFESRLMVSK